tara:strand:+ start:397 stop:963 length:567 start_codon:yes stop_codon:yes gene_type:complete
MEKKNILIDNALNIKHTRFKNECLIYLGVKEPITKFEWTMPPDKYEYSVIDISNFFHDSDNIHLDTITFSIKIGNKNSYPIKIINNNNFPFRPVSVLVNNTEYYPNMLQNISLIDKYFKEVFDNKCLCCETLLCKANWNGPKVGFKNILNEIYNIIQKINICKELIFCDKIVDKYFGHYLPIREFIHP